VVAPGVSDQRQKDRRELLHNLNTLEKALTHDPGLQTLDETERRPMS